MLLELVTPHTAGDPMSEAKWLNCRRTDLRQALAERGHAVAQPVISRLLRACGYRLRANVKQHAGKQHPDRDQQCSYLHAQRAAHLADKQPVMSVDSKKKELVGNFKNNGQAWCQVADVVDAHDFPTDAIGRATPYGIYDLSHHRGTVSVGQSADTPLFAVEAIAHWCATELRERFPTATHLLIEADRGGAGSACSRVWKQQLQALVADRMGLTVTVGHYPTGASKWNPVEHRLFSEISKTWAGCPLRSFALVLHYLNATRTATGLRVKAHFVPKRYTTGARVSDEEMTTLALQLHEVCPQWNDTIHPRPQVFPAQEAGEVILL